MKLNYQRNEGLRAFISTPLKEILQESLGKIKMKDFSEEVLQLILFCISSKYQKPPEQVREDLLEILENSVETDKIVEWIRTGLPKRLEQYEKANGRLKCEEGGAEGKGPRGDDSEKDGEPGQAEREVGSEKRTSELGQGEEKKKEGKSEPKEANKVEADKPVGQETRAATKETSKRAKKSRKKKRKRQERSKRGHSAFKDSCGNDAHPREETQSAKNKLKRVKESKKRRAQQKGAEDKTKQQRASSSSRHWERAKRKKSRKQSKKARKRQKSKSKKCETDKHASTSSSNEEVTKSSTRAKSKAKKKSKEQRHADQQKSDEDTSGSSVSERSSESKKKTEKSRKKAAKDAAENKMINELFGKQGRINESKTRCRHWPNCKNITCRYAHPKENCPKFPACWFGDKCIYIHPSIICKYGRNCNRPKCSYNHPQMRVGFHIRRRGRRGNYYRKKSRGGRPPLVIHVKPPAGRRLN